MLISVQCEEIIKQDIEEGGWMDGGRGRGGKKQEQKEKEKDEEEEEQQLEEQEEEEKQREQYQQPMKVEEADKLNFLFLPFNVKWSLGVTTYFDTILKNS